VPVALIERLRDELSVETVLTAYGLTEATGTVTMCRRGDDPQTIAETSGRAIPDTEVRVVDASGDSVATGEPGEVVVRGYNVMTGYFEDPDATTETVDAGGWLHTGDIGVLDDAGNLRITDRLKDMYVVGGFNAYPAEIEQALARHPGIAESAVIGVPDDRLGEVGRAFVVARPGVDLDPGEIVEWCRGRMANFKAPRTVVVVDVLPRNASGKVRKVELRQSVSPSS
jgi:acyl-CoA synthetase (AMP-forming)/AMP-acid ligase II